jgi:hypothetical protein
MLKRPPLAVSLQDGVDERVYVSCHCIKGQSVNNHSIEEDRKERMIAI